LKIVAVILLVISFFFVSCRNDTKELNSYLNQLEINLNSEDKYIIAVIPLIGCSSCIEQTIEELNNSADKCKIKVIFPSFDKALRYKYKSMLNEKIEYFIDYKEDVYRYNLIKSSDPVLFFWKNNSVVDRLEYNFKQGKEYLRERIDLFFDN